MKPANNEVVPKRQELGALYANEVADNFAMFGVPIVIPAFTCCGCNITVAANRGYIQKADQKYCKECGLSMMANSLNGTNASNTIDNT